MIGRLRKPYHWGLKKFHGRSSLLRRWVFWRIERSNTWGDLDSRSGVGSGLEATAAIRAALPELLDELGVRSLLDIPCGDFYWMAAVDLRDCDYIGGDLLPRMIKENRRQYGSARRQFQVLDAVSDTLPQADLILSRDLLVHLTLDVATAVLRNFARAGPDWVLLTTFPSMTENRESIPGDWRPLNMQLPPFSLPTPTRLINERDSQSGGAFADKSIGLWPATALQSFLRVED